MKQLTIQEEKNSVNKLREWILSQPHFIYPRLDDEFLLRFVRHRRNNFDEACKIFERYLKVRDAYPYCYKNLDICDESLYDLMTRGYMFPLLERDQHGRTVIFGRCAIFTKKCGHRPTDLFRAIAMTLETLLDNEDNQRNGFVYIFDQNGVSLSEVTYLGVLEMRKLAQSGEKSLPIKHKEVHWLNLPSIILTIFHFISSFLTEKLRKRLRFHKNLSSLHKCFPTRILPKEYGGDVPWRVMADKWVKTLKDNRERLLALDKMSIMDKAY